jgi:excisionase family DNA binding protein
MADPSTNHCLTNTEQRAAPDSEPATLSDLLAELRRVRHAIESQAAGPAEWLDIRSVCALTSLPRSTVYRLIALGRLPRPAHLGRQARRWSRTEVLRAMQAMIE